MKPERVFYYFDQLTKIPRCSFEEQQVADYLENFAKDHNLEVLRDAENNIVIKKDATSEKLDSPALILQGHMDMVCEKTENCSIDFSKDPIKYEIDGDYIIARETTLGADNGIAVAMALSILESDEIIHPPLEVLITTNEENGMTGARNLDGKMLSAKMLLNLDSETEGVACVACAGGERDYLIFKKEFEDSKEDRAFFEISITGLKGGHSGQEIKKGLGNSNKLLARALAALDEELGIEMADIYGGAKPNAIPRFAKSIISINKEDVKRAQDLIVKLNKEIATELLKVDPNVCLNFESTKNIDKVFTKSLMKNIINALNVLPDGVMAMSHDIDGLVQLSVNVGVIESDEDEIRILTNIRSASASMKANLAKKHEIIAKMVNAEYKIQSSYPAWEYKDESYLRDIAKNTYKELTGEDLKLEAIHAGLECGLFVETIGDIDMLSIGPNISGPHAPGENLQISSTQRVYDYLLEILKNI